MPLEVTFTLEEQDLDYFRDVMTKAQEGAEKLSEGEVTAVKGKPPVKPNERRFDKFHKS